jgi:hypothetical protein
MPISVTTLPTVAALLLLSAALAVPASVTTTGLHFAPNGDFAGDGAYRPARAGFNLAEVSSATELRRLPFAVRGLVWLGLCGGIDATFRAAVWPYLGNPKLFGFYLVDDPDPRFGHPSRCPADRLAEEADWLHANVPRTKVFAVLMNLGSSRTPSFGSEYAPARSHIDLFGFAAYPCRSELHGCDLGMIDRYVAAAEASGIPRRSMVPIFQAFGGGDWVDDSGGRYLLPTAEEELEILARWAGLLPAAEFDYAYSWGSQHADAALANSPGLQRVFSRHNRGN